MGHASTPASGVLQLNIKPAALPKYGELADFSRKTTRALLRSL